MSIATLRGEDRIRNLHDRAVRQLVEAHQRGTDEPLVLAVRYKLDDPNDIYLLEVLNQFPGGDDDELLETEFGPSAELIIVGKLHLVLGSPAQVQSAITRGDTIATAAKRGQVEFDNRGPEASALKKALGL